MANPYRLPLLRVCLQHMRQWAATRGAWCHYCSPWSKTETRAWQLKAGAVRHKDILIHLWGIVHTLLVYIIKGKALTWLRAGNVPPPPSRLESCPLWQTKDDLTLANSTTWKYLKLLWQYLSVPTSRAALTFLTDREMFSSMRSFTFSWSITGLLAAYSRLSADSLRRVLVVLKLTPPARLS